MHIFKLFIISFIFRLNIPSDFAFRTLSVHVFGVNVRKIMYVIAYISKKPHSHTNTSSLPINCCFACFTIKTVFFAKSNECATQLKPIDSDTLHRGKVDFMQ